MSSPVFAVQMVKPVMVHKATKCLLTCNNPGRDEQLVDGLSKWAGNHSQATQDSAQHNRRPATEALHQHAAERTWRSNVMLSD